MDLTVKCSGVQVSADDRKTVEATLQNVDPQDILNEINASEAVEAYGGETLLKLIGEDAAKKYFDLVPNEHI